MPPSFGHCVTRHEPLDAYLANREFVSSSQLRRFARLGAAALRLPERIELVGSDMGEALHCLLLEPDSFDRQFLALDGSVPANSQLSEDDAMQRARLDAWQRSALCRAREAILTCRQAPVADWLMRGEKELSIYWSDDSGARWKARPDCFCPEIIVEIKTTADCKPASFARTRERFNYDLQAAHYVGAVERLTAKSPRFAYVCVELAPPYPVWVHELGNSELARASNSLERVKTQYLEVAAAHFPAPQSHAELGAEKRDVG